MDGIRIIGRVLTAPLVLFVWCAAALMLGALPLMMGIGQAIYLSIKPIKDNDPKEVKEEIMTCLRIASLPFWGPFLFTYNWIVDGDMGIE